MTGEIVIKGAEIVGEREVKKNGIVTGLSKYIGQRVLIILREQEGSNGEKE